MNSLSLLFLKLKRDLLAEDLKVRGNFKAHQVPLPKAKSDENELHALESWLRSYQFDQLFTREKGFINE